MMEKRMKTKVIAITGTNGKSTTTAKISDMLNYAGYRQLMQEILEDLFQKFY